MMNNQTESGGSATIRQEIHLPLTPHEVFTMFTNSAQHSRLTGVDCAIEAWPGGHFRVGADLVDGKIKELVPDRRIVQTWRIKDYGWPAEIFSEVIVEIEADGFGSRVILLQTDVPLKCLKFIESGWYAYYWHPLGATL